VHCPNNGQRRDTPCATHIGSTQLSAKMSCNLLFLSVPDAMRLFNPGGNLFEPAAERRRSPNGQRSTSTNAREWPAGLHGPPSSRECHPVPKYPKSGGMMIGVKAWTRCPDWST
jgi:hypothetical protein